MTDPTSAGRHNNPLSGRTPPVCAPHATEPVAITLTREEWTEVRDLLDAKPANLGATPGVEHLFEEWAERGLLDTP